MKKVGVVLTAVVLCLVMTACNKQLGTYRAQCQSIVWDKFSVTLTLKKDGTFMLEPKKDGDALLTKDFKFKGKYKISKSSGKYDVLELTYDQNQNNDLPPKNTTTEGKISKNGKTVIFATLYNVKNLTLKK